MSEEVENTNDGTWSGLKKTIVGVAGTVVTAGGVWLSTLLGGGDKEATPAPVTPNIVINNTQQQQQAAGGGGKTVIVKEKTVEKPAAPVKKKEGDEFKQEAPKW